MVSYIYKFTSKYHGQTTHPQSRDSQGRETFLAPSAHNQTQRYDTDCTNYHLNIYKSPQIHSQFSKKQSYSSQTFYMKRSAKIKIPPQRHNIYIGVALFAMAKFLFNENFGKNMTTYKRTSHVLLIKVLYFKTVMH